MVALLVAAGIGFTQHDGLERWLLLAALGIYLLGEGKKATRVIKSTLAGEADGVTQAFDKAEHMCRTIEEVLGDLA